MIYQIKEVVKDVKVCIDQNKDSAPLLLQEDIDTLTLDEVIRSKILDGIARVHMAAPYYRLDGKNFVEDGEVYWDKDLEGAGWVPLPCDFMRLVVFAMSDWKRPVYEAISTDHPLYARQRSAVKGVRGTRQNPVCAIGYRPEMRALEFYSCKDSGASVARAVYLPFPKIEGGFVEISEKCYEAVVYTIAALVLSTYGDKEKGTFYFELAKTSMI